MTARNDNEIVDVVNDRDEVIGTALKTEVYQKGLSNRIVHVFVVDSQSGSLFVQRRSAHVRYLPNHYCTSAGGHVGSGEGYDEAAHRELEEEIGLTTELQFIEKFVYHCPETDPATPRFISLYVTCAHDGFRFAEDEVEGGAFMTPREFEALLHRGVHLHPQLGPCYEAYRRSRFYRPGSGRRE